MSILEDMSNFRCLLLPTFGDLLGKNMECIGIRTERRSMEFNSLKKTMLIITTIRLGEKGPEIDQVQYCNTHHSGTGKKVTRNVNVVGRSLHGNVVGLGRVAGPPAHQETFGMTCLPGCLWAARRSGRGVLGCSSIFLEGLSESMRTNNNVQHT